MRSKAQREQALKDHITAIRTQVKDLSKKDYSRFYNENNRERNTLDFVVMFIPSEGAMQLAMANDMVKRVQMFNKRYTKVRDTLRKVVDEGFHDLDTSLADGGQSIITSARKLLSYGATENKKYDSLKTNEESLMLEEYVDDDDDNEDK